MSARDEWATTIISVQAIFAVWLGFNLGTVSSASPTFRRWADRIWPIAYIVWLVIQRIVSRKLRRQYSEEER